MQAAPHHKQFYCHPTAVRGYLEVSTLLPLHRVVIVIIKEYTTTMPHSWMKIGNDTELAIGYHFVELLKVMSSSILKIFIAKNIKNMSMVMFDK